jgi:ketosteroid isomerase-like protein
MPPIPEACRAALARYLAATNEHDFDQVAQVLHPAAVHRFTDADCTSLAQTRRYFERTWRTVADEHYTATDVRWIHPTEGTAIATYVYEWSGRIEGEPRSGNGRATNVFVAVEDGRWLLALEHLSGPLNAVRPSDAAEAPRP